MNILSGILSRKISPSWEYTTNGTLWKLLPAPGGLLLGEVRDTSAKNCSFFCLEERTGETKWHGLTFNEQWWIGIERVHRDTIFFHEFARPDLPSPRKIFAVNLSTGTVRWSNDELQFLFAHEDSVYASKDTFESRVFFELDLLSGTILRELEDGANYLNVLRETVHSTADELVEFPESVKIQSIAEHFPHMKLTRHIVFGRIIGDVETVEHNGVLTIGYYENTSPNPYEVEMKHRLSMFDIEKGNLLFHDTLAEKLKTPAPDLFFRRSDCLFYIKGRSTIKAIAVPQS